MEKAKVERFLDISPDISFVQRFISRVRIRHVKSNLLSEKEILLGENDIDEKKKLVNKYSIKWETYLKNTVKTCNKILCSSNVYNDQKNVDDVRMDMLFCRLAYGFQPDEYLCFELEDQSSEERKMWVSDIDRYIAIYRMNNLKSAQILNNKARTLKLFREFYGRDAISIKTDSDFKKCEIFVHDHPVFVKKKVLESFGKSIELIDFSTYKCRYKNLFSAIDK